MVPKERLPRGITTDHEKVYSRVRDGALCPRDGIFGRAGQKIAFYYRWIPRGMRMPKCRKANTFLGNNNICTNLLKTEEGCKLISELRPRETLCKNSKNPTHCLNHKTEFHLSSKVLLRTKRM